MRSPRSLSGKTRFAQVFTHGRRAASDGVTVWSLPAAGAADTYLGLAVSTRAGGAVSRNRVRRRLRAVVRTNACRPGAVVIRADRAAAGLSFQDLEGHVSQALRSAGALER